jgi:hypothetical protein
MIGAAPALAAGASRLHTTSGAGEARTPGALQARPARVLMRYGTDMGSWNDFIGPLIVVKSDEMRTLPLAISVISAALAVREALTRRPAPPAASAAAPPPA